MNTTFHLTTITPEMIDTKKHFFDSFGHMETEISACWVVRLAQEKGTWGPFTVGEMQAFYEKKGRKENFFFNKLSPKANGWLTVEGDLYENATALFAPTADFILRCYKSSPKA